MFVPQWPNNDDDDVQSALPSLSNGDNDTNSELKKEESDATAMNDNGASAEESTSKTDEDNDMMATNNNNNNHASTTTTTTTTTAEHSQPEDEGIEISSLMVSDTNSTPREQAATITTEYDMALQGGSSSSMEDDEEEVDEAMYACQMWTANFPDTNNNNNDDDSTDIMANNNTTTLTDGIESAFATFGGGDIWSTEAFALPSPLHDLLSSNAPLTLTKLLAEDELLQELRGCEVKLVEYFGRGEVVADLVECVFTEVPYENEVGGRERWCSEEVVRRERRRELREEREKKKELELERVGSCDVEDDDDDMDEDEKVHPKSKLLVSSPREDGEEPNVETQWISPAVSPDKPSQKAGGGGGWLFNRDDDDDELGEEEEDQRTPEEEYDLRFIRYPYMACEVLCSEVGTTLDVLVDGYIDVEEIQEVIHTKEGDDGVEGILTPTPFVVEELHDVDIVNNGGVSGPVSQLKSPLQPRGNDSVMFQPQEQQREQRLSKKRILDLIFQVLIDTPPASLDDRRAGYLEKLLVVLFRRRSQTMADYMNTSLILTRKSAPMSNQMQSSSYNSFGQLGGIQQQQNPLSLIEKYPSPNAPPMLMCALLDHIHSHSIMHVLQRLLVPSPQRQQGNSEEKANNSSNGNENENTEMVAAASSESDDDDDNPFSATNNDFMNAINQMNGNQQISLHDMDDEDVDDEDDLEDDLLHLFQCDWSEKPDSVLALLLDRLEGRSKSFLVEYGFPVGYSDDDSLKDDDVEKDVIFSCSRHASEVLVTIIQNSSLTSPLMISISSDPALKRVLDIISLSKSNGSGDELVPHDSKMTYAIMMLESLVLQLGGYGAVGTEGGALDTTRAESSQTNLSEIGPHTPPPLASMTVDSLPPDVSKADTLNLGSHLPTLLNELSSILTHPVTKTWLAPAQYTQGEPRPLLGTSRLRILRLVEALVLLGDASVDFDLQHSNILKHCIDLFWEFEWCSMLHQSVANFVVHVFEGGEGRLGLQEYFIEKCHLIERLVDSFSDGETIGTVESELEENNEYDGDDGNGTDVVAPVSEEDVDSAMERERECLNDEITSQQLEAESTQEAVPISGKNLSRQMRKGHMGHIIIMCQALANASSNTSDDVIDESEGNESDITKLDATAQLHSASGQQNGMSAKTSSNPSQIYCIIRRNPVLFEKWQQFTLNALALEMSVQSVPLGGQQMNATDQGETAATSDSLTQLTSATNDTLDDLSSEPSGHLIFGGNGATVGDIDMDENDLDIAVSMMEHLSLPPSNGESDRGQSRGHNRRRALSKENNVGHNFGSIIPTTTEFKDYVYDDPLGGVHAFDNEDDDGENVEKGESDDGNNIMSDAMVVIKDEKETDSTSSDESSVEEDQCDDEDDDVPVMDLFAGNVPFENGGNSFTQGDGGWANFDSLDADLSQTKGDATKNSNGEDPFSFSKTPFDFVDSIEEGE